MIFDTLPAVTHPPIEGAQKHTLTLEAPSGPFVVDVWQPNAPIEAAPVLLIHGWGGTGTYWEGTAALLSQMVPVIVPDLPGTGRSQPVRAPQDLFAQVDSLLYLLDMLSLDSVQVVGHSMGSAMALLMADAQPHRAERLLLTSLSFFVRELEEQVYRKVMKVFRVSMTFRPDWLASVPGLPYMMAARYFHHIPQDNDLLRRGFLDYLQLDGGTAAACADDAPTHAIPQAGARVTVPTLLVACRQDRLMPPQNVDYTVQHIPGSRVIWIDDCGHMPMLEKPDEYHAILRDFLTV